jgi:hypothetical protein
LLREKFLHLLRGVLLALHGPRAQRDTDYEECGNADGPRHTPLRRGVLAADLGTLASNPSLLDSG